MLEQSWLRGQLGQELVDAAVSAITRKYRVDRARAEETVIDVFSQDKRLGEIVQRGASAREVMRTRVYREDLVAIKRRVYYELRRYKQGANEQSELISRLSELKDADTETADSLALRIAELHASTKERLKDRSEFYRQLFFLVGSPTTILDVGSGMSPLLFPFGNYTERLRSYVAADKDPTCISAVNAYAGARGEPRLLAVLWDMRSGWEPLIRASGIGEFDVALLLKLVPVIQRQSPELLNVLAETPAKTWVVTGSRTSMTKHRSIEGRERRTLTRFCEMAKRRVVADFSVSEEFGLIMKAD